ncbi:hypothetical protein ILYODFUR_001906 [Ilyodon furcidens]|uniref:Uncharacterized protein n=1 Tax=Ilyodon furcidens TaxID=33524 RepID=A0ABV0UDD7_9TELE
MNTITFQTESYKSMNCAGVTGSRCEWALLSDDICSTVLSSHQRRRSPIEIRQMPGLLWQLCFAMGNMLSHLGLSQPRRCEGRDNARQKWVEGSSGCRDMKHFHRCWCAHVTDPEHQHWCHDGDAPSG